jgi:flagellar hook-length control protein FliK
MFDATALLSDTIRKPVSGRSAASRPSSAQADFDKLLTQPKAEDVRRPAPASRLEGKDVPAHSQSRHNDERRAEPSRRDDARPARDEARGADRQGQKRTEAEKPRQAQKDAAPETETTETQAAPDATTKSSDQKTSDQSKPTDGQVASAPASEPVVTQAQLAGQVLALAQTNGTGNGEGFADATVTGTEGALTPIQTEAATAFKDASALASATEPAAKGSEAEARITTKESAPVGAPVVATAQALSTAAEAETRDGDQATAIGSGAGTNKSILPQHIQPSEGKGAETASTDTLATAKNAGEQAIAAATQDASTKPAAAAKEAPRVAEVQSSSFPASGIAATQSQPTIGEAGATKTAQAAPVPDRADAPVPVHAMAVEVGMRAMRGAREFSIRLDPENLGRVDIQLEISEAGEVQAKLVVERVETLALLQRDAKTLERAFDQAGLKSNPDGLQFSLRDPGQQGQQRQDQANNQDQSRNGRPTIDLGPDRSAETEALTRRLHLARREVGGVDISI